MILLIPIFYIIICALVAISGNGKNVGYWGVFFISLFLSPVIGLIVGLVSSRKKDPVIITNVYQQPPPPQQQHATNGKPDKYAELERLADMRNKGILTEEEFQREKDRVLKG